MKTSTMISEKSALLFSFLLTMSLLISSCGGKKGSSNASPAIKPKTEGTTPEISKIEIPGANHNVKPLDIGVVENFAVMAYSSITSAPSSVIKGKVGLKPGGRSAIFLDATEVSGGPDNIYSGDDLEERGTYIALARENLINAYREAAARATDKDKLEIYAGNFSGRVLPAGVYKWTSGVTLNSDVTLEGTEKDVWIFQITGNVSVSSGVHIHLSGGAQARNVFWQVSGKVSLEENTEVPGSIMSQLTFEMKNSAKLIGRALVKNGKLIMSQNTIEMP